MPSHKFKFMGTSEVILAMVNEAVESVTGAVVSTTTSAGDANTGTLLIDAQTQGQLDEAVNLIQKDVLFSKHFK